MMEQEIDNFKAEIKTVGNSLMIIIPYNIRDFGGYKEGDKINVNIRKLEETQNENQ